MYRFLECAAGQYMTSAVRTVRRETTLGELEALLPVGAIDIAVKDGVVTFSGVLTDNRQREALCVAAESIPGVKHVEDRLALLVPGTGIVGEPPIIVGPPAS